MDLLICGVLLLSTYYNVIIVRRLRDSKSHSLSRHMGPGHAWLICVFLAAILQNYQVVEFDREEYMDHMREQAGWPPTLRAALGEF